MGDFDVGEVTTDASTAFPKAPATHTYYEGGRNAPSKKDGSDDVDPRRLMEDPDVDALRWLYRTSLGKTLVDKPVDDAFKNGFEIKQSDSRRDYRQMLDGLDWVDVYKDSLKKARRDGFALTYLVLEDDTSVVGEDPLADDARVESIHKLETITLDDLAHYKFSRGTITAGAQADPLDELEYDEYEIRPTGIVMDTDPTSATYKEPLGYLMGEPDWIDYDDPADVKFYHRNRFMHHVVNRTVDGDLDAPTLGRWEGDSTLVSSYHLLRGLKKGNWSLMQTIFRYAAKMYHVSLPEDADEEDFDKAEENLQNLNAKSEVVTPYGYEMQDFQTDGQLQPREYFDVLFDQVCATSEMTKSVLFGTQSGTVTGSETDIKNYFNKVERLRTGRIAEEMNAFVSHAVKLLDSRASDNFEADFTVDWEPLFTLSELDRAERLTRVMQSISAGIDNFVLTPEEARSILQEEWAEADIDWTDSFTETEREFLKSLNINQMGAETAAEKVEAERGTEQEGGRNGGRQVGQTQASAQPTSDGLSDTDVDRIAERMSEMMEQ